MAGVDWNAVQAISTSILVLTSAGAIGYAALQLRHEREYRTVSNLEKQLTVFQSEGFQSARKRLATDRLVKLEEGAWELGPLDRDSPPVSALEVLDFYEHLGLLVKKGHLEVYDVWHTFYEWAQPVYVDLRLLIEDKESPFSDHYSDLKRLMRRMDNIQIARMHRNNANHYALWTPERIIDHYNHEVQSGARTGSRPWRGTQA